MALSNAEKQARWRDRNLIRLTDSAQDIASKLVEMDDQNKLRKIAKHVNDHLRHPDRSSEERDIALGKKVVMGINGPLGKKAALAQLRNSAPDHSYRVEAVTADGRGWGSGVRLGTPEEAQVYADSYARFDLEGYVTSDIIRCDGEPSTNSIIRSRKGGRPTLTFAHGTCGSLTWHPLDASEKSASALFADPLSCSR